jgi:aminoglycoside phosphotransferase (APT) family kinase protein
MPADERALEAYLEGHLPGEGPVEVRRHIFGHSNETFFVSRDGREWVLRRPPPGEILPGTHDVMREYRILAALAGTPVRAPRVVHACADPALIGVPFYLMDRVDGVVLRAGVPASLDRPAERRRASEELVDALVELHAVDLEAVGLQGFGKPEGFVARQIRRRSEQLEATTAVTRPLPELDPIPGWLTANLPASPPPSIVHGDYNLHNVAFAPGAPARLVAIYDWELATVGDPLTDVGWLVATWREAGDEPGSLDDLAQTAREGFLSRAELVARYEERSGRRVGHLTFYMVLALFRLAVALEGLYALHLTGRSADPWHAEMRDAVPALGRRARELAAL